MTDELDLDIGNDGQDNPINKRITQLTSKVGEASKAAEEANAKAEAEATARIAAEKERDFFKDFSMTASKYQNAAEYQDQIKAKVLAGYSVEDATVSVLNAEGKFTPVAQPQAPQAPAAGGSAVNQNLGGTTKPVADMSRDERRQALMDAEKRGDIALN